MSPNLSILRTSLAALALLCAPVGIASAQRAPANAEQPAKASAPVAPVNLNTATVDQLLTLPGIGPSKAAAIVETRQKIGGFKKLEDLMRVKGIGRATFRKLEPMIKL